MQYTFSNSHRAKLSDSKTGVIFLVHAVDTSQYHRAHCYF